MICYSLKKELDWRWNSKRRIFHRKSYFSAVPLNTKLDLWKKHAVLKLHQTLSRIGVKRPCISIIGKCDWEKPKSYCESSMYRCINSPIWNMEHAGQSCILFLGGSEKNIRKWHYSISAGGVTLEFRILWHLDLTLFPLKSSVAVFSFLIMELGGVTLYFSAVPVTRALKVIFQILLILQRRPYWNMWIMFSAAFSLQLWIKFGHLHIMLSAMDVEGLPGSNIWLCYFTEQKLPGGTKPQVVQHLFQVVSRGGILLVSFPMKNSYMSFESRNIFLLFLQHAVRSLLS